MIIRPCAQIGPILVLIALPAMAQTTASPTASEDSAAVARAAALHWAAMSSGDSARVASHRLPDLTMFATEVERRVAFPVAVTEPYLLVTRGARPVTELEGVRVQVYGDVGVATFYLAGTVVRPDGSLDNRRRRVTEVWVRQLDGSWKAAHRHDSVFNGQPTDELHLVNEECRGRKDCVTW